MFTWDNNKAVSNFEKHNISFEEATTVFLDPEGLDFDTAKHKTFESRNIRLGASVLERILVVVYTVRKRKDGKETIRIISARQASRKERKAYSGL